MYARNALIGAALGALMFNPWTWPGPPQPEPAASMLGAALVGALAGFVFSLARFWRRT